MSLFQCLSRKWGRGIFPQYSVEFRRAHPHHFELLHPVAAWSAEPSASDISEHDLKVSHVR
jgi:hypothetical protein